MENNKQLIKFIIENLHKIIIHLIIINGVIGPGFIFLFVYDRSLFTVLHTLKLIIFAITITMPVYIFNLGIVYKFFDTDKVKKLISIEDTHHYYLTFTSLFSVAVFYVPTILYYYKLVATIRGIVFWAFIVQFVILIFGLINYCLFPIRKHNLNNEQKSVKNHKGSLNMQTILTSILVLITALYAFFTFLSVKASERMAEEMSLSNQINYRPYVLIEGVPQVRIIGLQIKSEEVEPKTESNYREKPIFRRWNCNAG